MISKILCDSVGGGGSASHFPFANISQTFVEHLFSVLFVCKRLFNVCAVRVTFFYIMVIIKIMHIRISL